MVTLMPQKGAALGSKPHSIIPCGYSASSSLFLLICDPQPGYEGVPHLKPSIPTPTLQGPVVTTGQGSLLRPSQQRLRTTHSVGPRPRALVPLTCLLGGWVGKMGLDLSFLLVGSRLHRDAEFPAKGCAEQGQQGGEVGTRRQADEGRESAWCSFLPSPHSKPHLPTAQCPEPTGSTKLSPGRPGYCWS